MVKQQKPSKTSSAHEWHLARGEKRYEIKTSIKYEALLPRNTELHINSDGDYAADADEGALVRFVEVKNRYAIAGTLGDERPNASRWNEMPHEAFANLRLDDTKAVAAFVKTRGVLWGIVVDGSTADLWLGSLEEKQLFPSGRETEWSQRDSPARFLEGSTRLFEYQQLIRRAWTGDSAAAREIEKIALRDLEINPSVDTRGVTLVAKKLGSLIFVLFLRDCGAGKCGVCSNPDCPARYFLKSRKTQKFCESGPCVTYARRRYALKYWHDKGAKRRAKQQTKVQRRAKR
jgi:hypothetical protein